MKLCSVQVGDLIVIPRQKVAWIITKINSERFGDLGAPYILNKEDLYLDIFGFSLQAQKIQRVFFDEQNQAKPQAHLIRNGERVLDGSEETDIIWTC